MSASPAPSNPPIEAYGLIGDGLTAALVSDAGSVDWLCWPRFDGPACFAALLGTAENGNWSIAPAQPAQTRRRYRDGTLILQTVFTTADGEVALIDFLQTGTSQPRLVRIVEGRHGDVAMRMRFAPRFGTGAIRPELTPRGDGLHAHAGAEGLILRGTLPLHGENTAFTLHAGQRIAFVLADQADAAPLTDPNAALSACEASGTAWSARGSYRGPHGAMVRRSLLTLKALIHRPTGGMVAAPTTSLPESLGGSRNWDYRYCWLRDSALAAQALARGGHGAEAIAWCGWLERSLAGPAAEMQIMYGLGGERHLPEREAAWLPGYQGARPVRLGNAAHDQLQLDVTGEIADTLHLLRATGIADPATCWDLQRRLTEHLVTILHQPDEGIWEVRGGRRHFTHSKIMAWVALDRALHDAAAFALPAPHAQWEAIRSSLHAEICSHGFDTARNSFVQSYGATTLDASLLLLPATGFLSPGDPRIGGTVDAIAALLTDGLVQRYDTAAGADGLPPGEGAFLACSFWLVDAYRLLGRHAAAAALFQRLTGLANDLGLLAEEYDTRAHRLVGNFPQAFSHLALVNAACGLAQAG